MNERPRPHRWLCRAAVVLVAVAFAAFPSRVRALRGPDSAEAERLMAAAETALDEGKHREAGELLGQAHRTLPENLRTGAVGKSVVLHAADAYESAWLASDDVADLDAAIALLTEHNAAPDARDETVQRELARLQVLRARLMRKSDGEESFAVEPLNQTPNKTRGRSPRQADAPTSAPPSAAALRRHRQLGITLVTLGSVMSAAAAVLGGFSVTYDQYLDAGGTTHFDSVIRPAVMSNAITFGVAGPILTGFGTRDLLVVKHASMPSDRYAAMRRGGGIGLTTLAASGMATSVVLFIVGGVRWRTFDPENGAASEFASSATLISEAGIAIMIGSIGLLAPGIALLVAKDTPRFAIAPAGRGVAITGRF